MSLTPGIATGDALKQMGLFHVEMSAQVFVETMRSQARMICRRQGYVTTDDLREYADSIGLEPHHKNAWGAVLKRPEFKAVGYVPSRLATNRHRVIRQWALG